MSYADVNGISLYYAEHGPGQPLILLHGGLGMSEMRAPLSPLLAKDRRVITVDLQAHGHTADAGRPLRCQTLADDVAALIGYLGLEQADVMGSSLGASESLVGMDQMGAQLAGVLTGSPMYQVYAQVAPPVQPTRFARRTSSSSTRCSPAGSGTRTGTARSGW